jgi:hypothetical protein
MHGISWITNSSSVYPVKCCSYYNVDYPIDKCRSYYNADCPIVNPFFKGRWYCYPILKCSSSTYSTGGRG